MPQISLPDGSKKKFNNPVTVYEVARSISEGLAKAALAGKVNGILVDTDFLIKNDSNLKIITAKDQEGLDIIRHSTSHLLAYAVKELFPEAQYAIGPTIENGFYYDFSYKRPFTVEDLAIIEKKMHELAKFNFQVHSQTVSRDEAIKIFEDINEPYKVEIIKDIPENQKLTIYREGNFIDLCRGPHVPSIGKLKIFKLMKVSGAYWRGNSNNEMLQRIYGTAWATKEELRNYLTILEEAEKRDHRKLGKLLDLFHIQEEAPGMVFWHPKGYTIWRIIEEHIRKELQTVGYEEVRSPLIMDKSLWEKSGHWDNYKENMFTTESEKRVYAIKPMNCPGHVEIFKKKLHSYKDLPVRMAEFGSCHRNEPSGALHGLMRVRGFVQDDAHIFCTEDQINTEAKNFNTLVLKIYKQFGFTDVSVKLSLRPKKRAGDDKLWDKAEEGLRKALKASCIEWEELEGEGAFYGPKVEYHIKDALGRSWQCGTIQLDFVLPERLSAEYVTEHNTKSRPVMLHRAVIGSFERFIGILIEHYAGHFPLWLAPIQVAIMNITENQEDYTREVENNLKLSNFRTILDVRNEKIGFKIREHSLQKIPYHIIIGNNEKQKNNIAVRHLGNDLDVMSLDKFKKLLENEINFNS